MSETDLISRQAALHYIADWQYGEAKVGNEAVYDTIEKCYKMIEQLPSVQPQRWIPVTEELPDELGDIVVISTKGGRVREAMYVPSGDEQAFVTKDCWYCHGEVVAWMPLPEPYKE